MSIFCDSAIAGYGVAIRFEHLFTLPVIGLNIAVISIAGQNFGARRFDRIREVYFKAILIGVIIMCFAGVTIYLFSESIIYIFITKFYARHNCFIG